MGAHTEGRTRTPPPPPATWQYGSRSLEPLQPLLPLQPSPTVGSTVSIASNGEEGYHAVRARGGASSAQQFDLVLMDCDMPVMKVSVLAAAPVATARRVFLLVHATTPAPPSHARPSHLRNRAIVPSAV